MDYSQAQSILQQIQTALGNLGSQIHAPDWACLSFSSKGVENLFDQVRICGQWHDYGHEQLVLLQLQKLSVVTWVKDEEVSIELLVASSLAKNVALYISRGMAANERTTLSEIEVGGRLVNLKRVKNSLLVLDQIFAVVDKKLQFLMAFRKDAKSIAELLNFGNYLKELH